MTDEQMESLELVLYYVLESEKEHYLGYVAEGNNPDGHVWTHAHKLLPLVENEADELTHDVLLNQAASRLDEDEYLALGGENEE